MIAAQGRRGGRRMHPDGGRGREIGLLVRSALPPQFASSRSAREARRDRDRQECGTPGDLRMTDRA